MLTYLICVFRQTLPVAIASVRNVHSQCPREVLQFILDLIKYNDNRLNKVHLSMRLRGRANGLQDVV